MKRHRLKELKAELRHLRWLRRIGQETPETRQRHDTVLEIIHKIVTRAPSPYRQRV
ncbi:MAG: hypothetical protein KJZ78_23280 [Bryobacteraceae bacterium]|nr:hypothetical protein [Bryobacteraceae bacterium]